MIKKNIKKIKEMIRETLAAAGMDLDIRHDPCGINLSYNFILNYIGFDVRRISSSMNEIQAGISLEDYVKTFSLHELGHAMDREALLDSLDRTVEIYKMKQQYSLEAQYSDTGLLSVLIEEHEMNIAFERTAWANAKSLNRKFGMVDWKAFELLKNEGLKTYLQSYEKDLIIYENLLAQRNGQIAQAV